MTTAMKDAAGGGARMETDQAAADLTKKPRKGSAKKDPNVGEDTHPGGVDRDALDDADFAGPHRSFPVASPGDVSDAMSLAHHADNPDAVRANIRTIARRKGFPVPAEKLMSTWTQQSTGNGYLTDGHSSDSPANAAGVLSGPLRHPATGAFTSARSLLASGHYVTSAPPGGDPHDPGHVDSHLWQQPPSLMPRQLATLTQTAGSGPIASSIAMHCGMARLQQLDHRSAASPFLDQQLTAPTTGNPALAAVTPARPPAPTPSRNPGAAYLPYDRDANSLKSAAPGSRFTTRIPMNGD